MAQGLLKGVAVGALVSAGLVVVASQILPPPRTGDLPQDAAVSSPPTPDVVDRVEPAPGEDAVAATEPPTETADAPVAVDADARGEDGTDVALTPSAADPPDQPSQMAQDPDADGQGPSIQPPPETPEMAPSATPEQQTAQAQDAADPMPEPMPDAANAADDPPATDAQTTDTVADAAPAANTSDADPRAAETTPDTPTAETATAGMDASQQPADAPFADTAGAPDADPVADTAPPEDPAQQIAALSQPDDGAVPRLPGADTRVGEPTDPVAPTAPPATTAPVGQTTVPRAQPAQTPSLAAPTDPGATAVTPQPQPDDIVLPVPESLPPALPEPDIAPVQQDAPAPRIAAEADPVAPAMTPAPIPPESVTIDGAPVSDAPGLEMQPSGESGIDAQAPMVTTPDTTGRDSVRVNRLAQITPPEPEPDPDAEGASDTDGAQDEIGDTIGEADDTDAADRPAEMALEAQPEQDAADATETDAAAANAPPSSNLIERRLQAIARAADGTDADTDPGAASTPAVTSGPTVRRAAAPPETAASPPSDSAADQAPPPETLTGVAIDDFDQPFENPAGLPLVSVVLLDYGGPRIDLPLPLSIALDASQPNVAARAAQYRAAGYEVLVIPSLPQGATAQDVEQALQVNLDSVSGAVGVIPDPGSDLSANRPAIETLVGRLSESGLGLLSFPSGLNRAQQIAAREDVPSGLVFRQIDSEGQDLRAVKRFLDQAAFRARQENAVILVGRNRPETRGALMEWRLGNRAQSVVLAPVTAAIRASAP